MKWNFEEIFLSKVCLLKGDRIKERRVIYTIAKSDLKTAKIVQDNLLNVVRAF